MPTDAKFSVHLVVRSLALVVATVWLVALLLGVFGAVAASTAAGLAVGVLVGAAFIGLGVWLGLRRSAAQADASRLEALEPLPPRER